MPPASDRRSNKCVFLAHCLLAQCVRANGVAKYYAGAVTPVVEFCLKNDINMMQLPCPETLFTIGCGGLPREPHGKKYYEKRGFREHCATLARSQARYMAQVVEAGIQILAMLGMEFSPACAVNYLNRGPIIIKDKGIFVEELQRELSAFGLSIRFIGVNQRAHKKLAADLDSLLR